MVWRTSPDSIGKRVRLMAFDLEDAKSQIKAEHGEQCIISVWNEDDAMKPRSQKAGLM